MNRNQIPACCLALALCFGGMVSPARAQGATQPPAKVYSGIAKGIESEFLGAAEAMPADKYGYAPSNGKFDGVRTFGQQVQHVIGANYHFFSGFGVPGAMDEAKIKNLKSKDELVQGLKDSFAYVDKAIATITPENAFAEVGSGEGKTTRAGAASYFLFHTMDHYGQMVEYLRMNNIVPPASAK